MAQPPDELVRLQGWLHAVITDPLGVAAGIESEAARERFDVPVEEVVTRSQSLDSVARLGVYGNAYFARLLECLAGEFDTLNHALGDETFGAFAIDYLRTYPPRSYTLSDLGARFPQYLRETQPAEDRAADGPTWSHFVIDLATLERCFAEVFDGSGTEGRETLSTEDIAAIPPEEWPRCRLVPVPCLRLERFDYPVHEYRTAVKREEEPPPPLPEPTRLVVTRREYVVRRATVGAEEFALLHDLVSGRTVGESVERLADAVDWSDDELAGRLGEWFREWATADYFDRIERPVAG